MCEILMNYKILTATENLKLDKILIAYDRYRGQHFRG